jgi:hypothetical protein
MSKAPSRIRNTVRNWFWEGHGFQRCRSETRSKRASAHEGVEIATTSAYPSSTYPSEDSVARCNTVFAGADSGIGESETMSPRRALLYVPANTGSTVGFHPANFSPWNERELPCI